jgi:5-methylcytosine-specific restriction endonuclease McrA
MNQAKWLRRTPLKRSWLGRPKKKVRKVSWRSGRIREDAAGMARLRSDAFRRSGGLCECGRKECESAPIGKRFVTWIDGQLHHVISRARGGSDVLENVQFVRRECHRILTGEPQWSRRAV